LDSEWLPLKAVLLHRPGLELEAAASDPSGSLMLDQLDPFAMAIQHDGLAQAYRAYGVDVSYVQPTAVPPPNQLFCADLFAMTPEGAILGRPASTVRAGEERWVAQALSGMGVPILRSVRGEGTFEGADLMWLAPGVGLLAEGLRTNPEGASQVRGILEELGVTVHMTKLPHGSMHLMGQLRIVDRDLAITWKGNLPQETLENLASNGFTVAFWPDEDETRRGFGHNFVTLGPREILMPEGNPVTRAFYEELGVTCRTVEAGEIGKAAGSIGCLTGIIERERSNNG
jgi:N-dimethylarginine dimethylaminohydrolase